MIYLIGFTVSCILIKWAESSKKKYGFAFLSFFALLIPILIAGFRAESIGTDIEIYVRPLFDAAKYARNYNEFMDLRWFSSWRYLWVRDYEIGFRTLVYLVTKIFDDFSAVLISIHTFIIVPIYFALCKYRKYFPIWLGMLIFYLMDFNTSLNMMRQFIAIAILFYGFHHLVLNNNKTKYLLFVCGAMLFHTSAFLGFVIYFVYEFFKSDLNFALRVGPLKMNKSLKILLVMVVSLGVLFTLDQISGLLGAIGLGRFSGYISGDVGLQINQIIVRLPLLVLMFTHWKKMVKRGWNVHFFFIMTYLDILVSQLTSVNIYSGRIGEYFSIFNIIYLPLIYMATKQRVNKMILMGYVIAYLLFYWFYYFVFEGIHQTYPYLTSL